MSYPLPYKKQKRLFSIASSSDTPSCPVVLGDVILSTETTQRQAQEHRHSFEQELYFLLIHGILHLLGYDHHTDEEARIMENLEQSLLQKLTLLIAMAPIPERGNRRHGITRKN